jgi:hypothetical protein
MQPGRWAWRGPSLTCTVDGLDHLVSADAAAQGIAARQGTYTAMCGHLIYVAALVSSAGPLCSRCAQSVTQVGAAVAGQPCRRGQRKRAGLRRLFGLR